MSNLEHARCPSCNKTANGLDRVHKLFGTRQNGKYLIVQSWCRVCRKKERQNKRLLK